MTLGQASLYSTTINLLFIEFSSHLLAPISNMLSAILAFFFIYLLLVFNAVNLQVVLQIKIKMTEKMQHTGKYSELVNVLWQAVYVLSNMTTMPINRRINISIIWSLHLVMQQQPTITSLCFHSFVYSLFMKADTNF